MSNLGLAAEETGAGVVAQGPARYAWAVRFKLPLLVVLVFGCAPHEPPRWAQGGAALVIAPARWDRGKDDAIEIRADGKVLEDGDLKFVIDRAGRVVDDDYEPIGILMPEGQLIGQDNLSLGHVGLANAAPPGSTQAWLAVTPDGNVTYFDEDGDRSAGGRWAGCNGPQQRTCTLVTHLIAVQHWSARPRSGVTFGVGVGVGF
jgi:hypothetical protein